MRIVLLTYVLFYFCSTVNVLANESIKLEFELDEIIAASDYTSNEFETRFQNLKEMELGRENITIRAKWLLIRSARASNLGQHALGERIGKEITELLPLLHDPVLAFSLKIQLFFSSIPKGDVILSYRLGQNLLNSLPEGVNKEELTYLYMDMALVSSRLNLLDEAWKFLELSEELAASLNNYELLMSVKNSEGLILAQLLRPNEAITAFKAAIKIVKQHNLGLSTSVIYASIASAYFELENYTESQKYVQLSLDAAIDKKNYYAQVLAGMIKANTKYKLGEYPLALQAYSQVITLATKLKMREHIASGLEGTVRSYLALHDLDKAETSLIELSNLNSPKFSSTSHKLLTLQAELFFSRGNYHLSQEAWKKSVKAMKNEFSDEFARSAATSKTLLETDRKDRELLALTSEHIANKIHTHQILKRNYALTLSLFIAALCLIFSIFLLIKLKRIAARNRVLATTDELTQLANRRSIVENLQLHFDSAKAQSSNLSVFMADIDFFKQINDTYGHDVGDEVLKLVAVTCEKKMRQPDLVGRVGGEEFLFILPDTDIQQAFNIAERIRLEVSALSFAKIIRSDKQITISIGLSMLSDSDVSIEQLLKRADEMLYAAKKMGRNCTQGYECN